MNNCECGNCKLEDKDDEMKLKQVIVVREDLKMSPAKLAVQVAHGSIGAVDETHALDVAEWKNQGMKKIILGAINKLDLTQLYYRAKARNIPCFLVVDLGLTEFEGPELTALAIGPGEESFIDSLTANRKLYKGKDIK